MAKWHCGVKWNGAKWHHSILPPKVFHLPQISWPVLPQAHSTNKNFSDDWQTYIVPRIFAPFFAHWRNIVVLLRSCLRHLILHLTCEITSYKSYKATTCHLVIGTVVSWVCKLGYVIITWEVRSRELIISLVNNYIQATLQYGSSPIDGTTN